MSFDEIKAKYRLIITWKRLVLCASLAVSPSIYVLVTQWQDLYDEKELSIQERDVAEKNLNDAKEKKKNLPKLEEQIAKLENEIKEAKKKLPDEFLMDQILEKTEIMAQQLGVSLRVFHPGTGVISDTAFKYLELPIRLDVSGTFGQVLSFFDHIVHMDLLVHVRNTSMSLVSNLAEKKVEGEGEKSKISLDDEKALRWNRANAKVKATCDMVIFRSLTEEEVAAIQKSSAPPKNNPGGKR